MVVANLVEVDLLVVSTALHTDVNTDIHFVKSTYFGLRDLKMGISTKHFTSNFPHNFCMIQKNFNVIK